MEHKWNSGIALVKTRNVPLFRLFHLSSRNRPQYCPKAQTRNGQSMTRDLTRARRFYPGDWIRLYPDESYPHWRSAREQAANNDCEVCGESLAAEPYLWCQGTSQVARCPDCQETEWWADGYEIDEFGNPSCWDSNHTREERIAERERHCGSKAGVWLPVPGRAGLAT